MPVPGAGIRQGNGARRSVNRSAGCYQRSLVKRRPGALAWRRRCLATGLRPASAQDFFSSCLGAGFAAGAGRGGAAGRAAGVTGRVDVGGREVPVVVAGRDVPVVVGGRGVTVVVGGRGVPELAAGGVTGVEGRWIWVPGVTVAGRVAVGVVVGVVGPCNVGAAPGWPIAGPGAPPGRAVVPVPPGGVTGVVGCWISVPGATAPGRAAAGVVVGVLVMGLCILGVAPGWPIAAPGAPPGRAVVPVPAAATAGLAATTPGPVKTFGRLVAAIAG
jgi:hypothetical protein